MSDQKIIDTLAAILEETDHDWSHAPGVKSGSDAYKAHAMHTVATLRAAGIAVVDMPGALWHLGPGVIHEPNPDTKIPLCWMAYYSDWSGIALFATELAALRHAVSHHMEVAELAEGDVHDQVNARRSQ